MKDQNSTNTKHGYIASSFILTHKMSFLLLDGMKVLSQASENGSLMHHLGKYAGIKTPDHVHHSDPVLFEWNRIMPPNSAHDEVVIFTPSVILRKTEVIHSTKRGSISIAVLREVTLDEVLAYARTYPNFEEFVYSRYIALWFRVQKISQGRFHFCYLG